MATLARDVCPRCERCLPSRGEYLLPVPEDAVEWSSHHRSPYHKGRMGCAVDFKVPVGTPVRAARAGTVVALRDGSTRGGRSRRFDPYENWVEVRNADREVVLYGHLNRGISVVRNERIEAGQVIARSGATGTLAGLGPHLHFEVRRYVSPKERERDALSMRIRWRGGGHVPRDREAPLGA